ncbi:MAG: ABC transporter permease [Ilumatobacteraceae bacterium]
MFYALSGLALLIGAVAITNATLLNIIERRPEIGLRRALGATRGHITRQITLEAALTGTLAGILGATLGLLAVVATTIARQWTPNDPSRTASRRPGYRHRHGDPRRHHPRTQGEVVPGSVEVRW